jgi:N4 Gp49/Sf6 Gp66 family protein
LTVCALTLQNGFQVVGEAACASPENFNEEIGRRIARENARQKIWPLLGYVLRSALAGSLIRIDPRTADPGKSQFELLDAGA